MPGLLCHLTTIQYPEIFVVSETLGVNKTIRGTVSNIIHLMYGLEGNS